jgi:hypothetical protein
MEPIPPHPPHLRQEIEKSQKKTNEDSYDYQKRLGTMKCAHHATQKGINGFLCQVFLPSWWAQHKTGQ